MSFCMLRQHSCFAACETCNLHTVGQWRPSTAPPAYRLNHSLWSSLGLVGPPPSSSQHYGLCDDRADQLGKPRQLYEWHAEACDLPAFERKRACAVLRGRQVVVAGDSTAGQLFLSLVLALGGIFGRNSRHTTAISDLTASACNDTCRLNFIRNDLLLWSTHRSEFNRARECDKLLKADSFVQRAVRDAHLLVIATGHHFPASIESAASSNGGRSYGSFFASSLNYTLTNLLRARGSWGHSSGSVVLMGASIPVPSCSRFDRPLAAGGWLAADAQLSSGAKYSPRWRQMHRINIQLQWLAVTHQLGFVDIAAPSTRWPDGMMARHMRGSGSGGADEDCLHSCLPGPVDTWSRLLIEQLIVRRENEQEPLTQQMNTAETPSDGRRFFAVEASAWLKQRNAGAQFESCSGSRSNCVRAEASRQPWWPFAECTRRRSLSFCDGAECHGPVRPSRGVLRLCDGQSTVECRNLSVIALRAAVAHGLLR